MKDIYGRPIPSPVICEGCKQQISGEVVEALGKKWHPKCFVCPGFNGKRCGLLLKGTFYTGEDG